MYSAKETAEMTGLTTATLRYYEKEQLLPAIERTEQRYRQYSDTDIEWIKMVQCLRMANVPIRSIRAEKKLVFYEELLQSPSAQDLTYLEEWNLFKSKGES